MNGVDLSDVRREWIEPALKFLPDSLNTPARAQLVLGIGNKETQYRYVRQIGGGPALGFWQMEPATHDDMWRNFIRYRPELQSAALRLLAGANPDAKLLTTRMDYAALMAELHVYRAKDVLPAYGDALGQATFWKDNFNTHLGKGTVAGALPYFQQAVKV
ncbi:hypothetical protein AD948_04460 [Acetobacter senegalensis]|uniref:Transglycosylase SLT domain-containing protein n=1 Tax=Acetobacter senegalensis TaxID=446692 RepID=A0A149U5K3_9PROT|nr:hypothetical protein [Acetobacter senegalensis]KXV60681.1 hypothetical protein AD948_04460 [Acetobacter senegalensis]